MGLWWHSVFYASYRSREQGYRNRWHEIFCWVRNYLPSYFSNNSNDTHLWYVYRRQVESSKRQDKSQNITSREGAIEEKRFAEYLQRNNDSWLNFASELGHNVPPSGLVFVTGCDQTLACAAAIDSHSSTGLKIFISIGGSAKGWESFAVEMGSQSPDSPGPRSMLSYASSFVYGAAMAIFSFALQWPSKQQTTCHDRDAFLRTEHDASWLHPKLLVQSIESSIGAKDILHEREDTMTQGTNTEQTQFSSSEQDYLSQGSNDDKISRVPQSVEDPDSGSEQVGTSQIYEEQVSPVKSNHVKPLRDWPVHIFQTEARGTTYGGVDGFYFRGLLFYVAYAGSIIDLQRHRTRRLSGFWCTTMTS